MDFENQSTDIIKNLVELNNKEELINKFLKTEAKKMLKNNEDYNEASKKFQLLCSVYGIDKLESDNDKAKTEDHIYALGGDWLEDKKIKSASYWDTVSPFGTEYGLLRYAAQAYYAEKKVAIWEKDRAKLEKKLAKAKSEKRIEKLKEKLSKGDEKIKDDIDIAKYRREALEHIKIDNHYFSKAILLMRRCEQNAVNEVIKNNSDNKLISDLIIATLNNKDLDYRGFYYYQTGRFFEYGKNYIQHIIKLKENKNFVKMQVAKNIQKHIGEENGNNVINIDDDTENEKEM